MLKQQTKIKHTCYFMYTLQFKERVCKEHLIQREFKMLIYHSNITNSLFCCLVLIPFVVQNTDVIFFSKSKNYNLKNYDNFIDCNISKATHSCTTEFIIKSSFCVKSVFTLFINTNNNFTCIFYQIRTFDWLTTIQSITK